MASDADQGERSEEATHQRREDFRKRGQVAQTKEFSSVLLLFSGVLLIWLSSRFMFHQIFEIFHQAYGEAIVLAIRDGNFWRHASMFAFERLALILAPMLGVFWLISFISSISQIGFVYN